MTRDATQRGEAQDSAAALDAFAREHLDRHVHPAAYAVAPSAIAETQMRAVEQAAATLRRTRAPDEVITQEGAPYMKRWYVRPRPDKNVACLFLHELAPRARETPHDHPWPSASVMITGTVIEQWWLSLGALERDHAPTCTTVGPGDRAVRPQTHAHKLEAQGDAAVSLFATATKTADWGFCRPGEHRIMWSELGQTWNTGEGTKHRPTQIPAGRPFRER